MINIDLLIQHIPFLLRGLLVSVSIAFLSSLIGLVGGAFCAMVQLSNTFFIGRFVSLFTAMVRGTPMLIQILFLYYVLPYWLGDISSFAIAVIAIGINSSAYISQVIRGGIQSIPQGQYEAARVIGLSQFNVYRLVILPQAVAAIIPSLGNELVTLVKDSALASVIGVLELSKAGRMVISQTYDSITVFFGVGVLYLIVTTFISGCIYLIEQRMRRHAQNN